LSEESAVPSSLNMQFHLVHVLSSLTSVVDRAFAGVRHHRFQIIPALSDYCCFMRRYIARDSSAWARLITFLAFALCRSDIYTLAVSFKSE